MKSEEFLDNLLLGLGAKNGNFINVGFDEISKNHLLMLLSNSEIKKKIICISSNNFHENTDKIFALNNKNELESIISLPIFKDDDKINAYSLMNPILYFIKKMMLTGHMQIGN